MEHTLYDLNNIPILLLFAAEHASAADQLSLALIWNRADIARTEIFIDDQKWEVCTRKPAQGKLGFRNSKFPFLRAYFRGVRGRGRGGGEG